MYRYSLVVTTECARASACCFPQPPRRPHRCFWRIKIGVFFFFYFLHSTRILSVKIVENRTHSIFNVCLLCVQQWWWLLLWPKFICIQYIHILYYIMNSRFNQIAVWFFFSKTSLHRYLYECKIKIELD